MKATVTNTPGLIKLARNASGRNRSVYEDKLIESIDPDGVHMLTFQFPHNDVEWRTQWLVKIRERSDPVSIWLDVDFDILDRLTTTIETDSEAG